MRKTHNWMVGLAVAAIALGASVRWAYATGACCTGGVCTDVANSGACGGFYLGDGTACATSNCTLGGCEINPLNAQNCLSVSKPECDLQEGRWLGAGVT